MRLNDILHPEFKPVPYGGKRTGRSRTTWSTYQRNAQVVIVGGGYAGLSCPSNLPTQVSMLAFSKPPSSGPELVRATDAVSAAG
jgi:hypothetical protein